MVPPIDEGDVTMGGRTPDWRRDVLEVLDSIYDAREVLGPERESGVPGKVSGRRHIAHPPPALAFPGGSRARHLDAPMERVIRRAEVRRCVDGKREWGRSVRQKSRREGRVVDAGGTKWRRKTTTQNGSAKRRCRMATCPTAQNNDDGEEAQERR
jgi:hypothetical protein